MKFNSENRYNEIQICIQMVEQKIGGLQEAILEVLKAVGG